MIESFLALPRRSKRLISIAADLLLLTFAFWSALALRFETFTPEVAPYTWQMIAAPLVAIPIFNGLAFIARSCVSWKTASCSWWWVG